MSSTPDAVVQSLQVLLILGIGAFLWFVGWRRYRLDVFRQRLFVLRDELFDLAGGADLAFDDYAYGGLRRLINNLIRFGHRATLFQLLLVGLFGSDVPEGVPDPYREWRASVDRIENPDTRKKVLNLHQRVFFELVTQIIATSPVLLVTLGLFICLLPFVIGATKAMQIVASVGERLPSLTMLEEEIDMLEAA
jgi:hypothetical protein